MTGPIARDCVDFWSSNVPKSTQPVPQVRRRAEPITRRVLLLLALKDAFTACDAAKAPFTA
ncbi:hypothetical protein [Amycolatopsis sp. BJA-103]|uniref:hypothetical protein n=1 Tax=Amycolatopsis sp. BJA-103 TaxID=1911175 RepID=UPI0011AF787C|nr:hypothetical protein [Amycolatopsis sp. BJA-103]